MQYNRYDFQKSFEDPQVGPNDRLHIELNKAGDRFVLTFNSTYLYKSDGIEFARETAVPRSVRRYMNRFPEKQRLNVAYPTEKISVPVSTITARILLAWPRTQIGTDSETIAAIRQMKQLHTQQMLGAAVVAEYKSEAKKVLCNGKYRVNENYPLAPHQKVALHASDLVKNYALFMEQGTGKTASVIARICNEAEKLEGKGIYRAIVVCPKGVRYNWKTEVEKFATCKGIVKVIMGNQLDRASDLIAALAAKRNGQKFVLVVMNYEAVESSLENFKLAKAVLMTTEGFDPETDKLFNLAVLDESQYIKTPSAKRSQAAHKLRDQAEHRMVLTGTPITNNPFDLFMQLEFLGKGYSEFGSYTAFKNYFGVFEAGGMGYEKLVSLQNVPLLQDIMARTSFLVSKDEALPDLPDKVYDNYEVEMTGEQQELYKQIATQILAEIEVETAGSKMSKEVEAQHILTKMLRLAQVTSGYVGFSEKKDELTGEVIRPKSEHVLKKNPKLEALVSILKEKNENQKVVVWCCFVPDIKRIAERLTAEGIDCVTYYGATSDKKREEAKDRFNNDPSCKVLIGNPDTAGTGLNLLGYCPERPDEYETNCDHEIFFSQNWKPDPRWQAEDRCHRRGTRTNVRITDLIVPNTIDVEIRERVKAKRDMANEVGNVSDMLEGIRGTLENLSV